MAANTQSSEYSDTVPPEYLEISAPGVTNNSANQPNGVYMGLKTTSKSLMFTRKEKGLFGGIIMICLLLVAVIVLQVVHMTASHGETISMINSHEGTNDIPTINTQNLTLNSDNDEIDVVLKDFKANEWNTVVKYSSGSGRYLRMGAATFWNAGCDKDLTSYSDDCLTNPATKCNRPYKHPMSCLLLNGDHVKQIKVSVYTDGEEKAYVTFRKEEGKTDPWFNASRVIDSYPWTTSELQRSRTNYDLDRPTWSITEGLNPVPHKPIYHSAHAAWLRVADDLYVESHLGCQLKAGDGPFILYSTQPSATMLATQSIAFITKDASKHGYDILGTDAESVCSDYLHTTLATTAEAEAARVNDRYDCCANGWAKDSDNIVQILPMTYARPSCGSGAGLQIQQRPLDTKSGVYCKTKLSDVGIADTLVIAVKLR